MDRSVIIRNILFTFYGALVGAGYASLTCQFLPVERMDIIGIGVLLPAIFAFFGLCSAYTTEWSVLQRSLFLISWPVQLLVGSIFLSLLPIMLMGYLPIAFILGIRNQRLFRKQMKAKGRYLEDHELTPKLATAEGTLIAEIGITGYLFVHQIWWTDEVVQGAGALPIPMDELFDTLYGEDSTLKNQYLKEHLELDRDRIFLTSLPPRYVESERFANRYSRISVVLVERTRIDADPGLHGRK